MSKAYRTSSACGWCSTPSDEETVAALEAGRSRGRNDDYPVRAKWRALIAGVVFQHASIHHELPVAFEVTRASGKEAKLLPEMLEGCRFRMARI